MRLETPAGNRFYRHTKAAGLAAGYGYTTPALTKVNTFYQKDIAV